MSQPAARALRPEQWEQLRTILLEVGDEEAASLSRIHGIVTAAAIGPEPLSPREWMPLIVEDPMYETERQAMALIGLLTQLYNSVLRALDSEAFSLTRKGADGRERFDPMAWLAGFWAAVSLRREQWFQEMEGSSEFRDIMLPFSLYLAEIDDDANEIEPLSARQRDALVDILPRYVLLVQDYWRAFGPHPGPPRRGGLVGRNELCPCGSGKKFKRCCGNDA